MSERTLLLVDDEEEIGAALSRVLRKDGYTILRARGGQEGLAMLAKNEVQVILSDQRMPKMSGVEFLTRAKDLYPNTIRMVLSGYADIHAVTDAINHGAIYKFLTKPWDNDMLCANVLEAFRHYELLRQKSQLAMEIQQANTTLASLSLELAKMLEAKEGRITRLVQFDQLTELPNRTTFLDKLDKALLQARVTSSFAGVILFDLLRFQKINETFGHEVGDQVLKLVAERLRRHVRSEDVIARLGGNEFGLILNDIHHADDAEEIARKIMATVSHDPFVIDTDALYVGMSAGITLSPQDGDDSKMLLRNAAAALRLAKRDGTGALRHYAPFMHDEHAEPNSMESELRLALERDEFLLHYQPKVNIATGEIVGVEALLRWRSPTRGLMLPDDFMHYLEASGLILQVDKWVLKTVCQQAYVWRKMGFPGMRVTVNLSMLQLRQADLPEVVRILFEKNQLAPSGTVLELDLKETMLQGDVGVIANNVRALAALGVHLAVDDFCTHHDSLSYLNQFPIHSLKIAPSIVGDMLHDHEAKKIVNFILTLGKNLGLKVIAEGVENIEQLMLLHEMECNEMQGFLFSHPVPVAEMTLLMQNRALVGMWGHDEHDLFHKLNAQRRNHRNESPRRKEA